MEENEEEVVVSENSSDESLDIKSDKFDSLKALYSSKIHITKCNVKVYDNLSKYEAVTKGLSPILKPSTSSSTSKSLSKESIEEEEEEEEEENAKRSIRSENRRYLSLQDKDTKKFIYDETKKNVLTRMKNILGPLEMILQCMEHKTRVKIYTRGERNIRGYILAYVVAFDKHWNLALEDCLEVWSRKVKRKAPALGNEATQDDSTHHRNNDHDDDNNMINKIIIKERNGKIETLERHVNQMMIRGEQIVIIIKLQ